MKLTAKEIIFSGVVLIVACGAFVYFFEYADREIVFLYNHNGWGPFHPMTAGRYWMLGLVLSGWMWPLFLPARWIKTDLKTVLKIISLPLIAGIVLITTLCGDPKMPFGIGLSAAIALLLGLAVGFSVAGDLIDDFKKTLVHLITGLGLVPFLILFRTLELPGKGLMGWPGVSGVILFSIAGGLTWMIFSFIIFKKYNLSAFHLLKGILFLSYVALPVIHYFTATPKGIPYITTSDNFFADNLLLRVANWLLAIFMVVAVKKITGKTSSQE